MSITPYTPEQCPGNARIAWGLKPRPEYGDPENVTHYHHSHCGTQLIPCTGNRNQYGRTPQQIEQDKHTLTPKNQPNNTPRRTPKNPPEVFNRLFLVFSLLLGALFRGFGFPGGFYRRMGSRIRTPVPHHGL